jgi:uncharacterized protein YfaS (alpha-2-macroglobulin family)
MNKLLGWRLMILALLAADAVVSVSAQQKPQATRAPQAQAPPAAMQNAQARAAANTAASTLHVDAEGVFFLLSSINAAQKQLVLKRPTEVTQLVRVDDKTQYLDDQGKPLKLSDLRAGDTVYVVLQNAGTAPPLVTRMQQGPMTMEGLHQKYLPY